MRFAATKEECPACGCRAVMLQVVRQCLSGGQRQRQDVLPSRFCALQRDRAFAPVDVVDRQVRDLAGAQSHVQCAADDGVTSPGHASVREYGEKPLNFVRLEGAGQ